MKKPHPASGGAGRPQRGERGKEMRDEREVIDDFSPFAFPSSLFTKCSLWFEECYALSF